MAEDKTRHQVKWVEATKENALANEFWLGLAALLCFLRLSDLCVTQTARGTPASECLSSSPNVSSLSIFALFMFTLLPQHLAKSFWKDWATWGGEAEPRGSDGRCRRSKKIVLEKQTFVEKQLNGLQEETSKLAERVTAALVICEEHMRDYHATRLGRRTNPTILQERICQITGTKWMHPCNVLEWK